MSCHNTFILAILAILGTVHVSAEALPEGVTICDGSSPVGVGAAFLLSQPIPYCMNWGACKSDYAQHPENPCSCPDDFEGPHCEFAAGSQPDCTLHCFSGGTCHTGAKSFELVYNDFTSVEDLQYCLCPEGASGPFCEKESQPCGDSHCLHGGTCVHLVDGITPGSYHCDCTTAKIGAEAFAGQYCEYKSTTFCNRGIADHNGYSFCVNEGTCKTGSHMGCNCPDGFTGPLCEFSIENMEYSKCNLECQNGGICRKGAKDVSFLEKFGLHRDLLASRYDANFEHCVCPRGFVGITCEYEMEVCPGQNYVCMHGGDCEITVNKDTGKAGVECDCTNAQTSRSRFAGQYCEVRSTEFCTEDGEKTPNGPGFNAFCTNGAECLDTVDKGEEHPGCECDPGFHGDHCEFGEAESGLNNGLIIGLSVGLVTLCLIAIAVVYCRRKKLQQRRSRLRRGFGKGYTDAAPAPTMDSINRLEPWRKPEVNLRDMAEHRHEPEAVEDGVSISSMSPSDSASQIGRKSNVAFTVTPSSGRATLMKGASGQSSSAGSATHSATNIGSDYSTGTDLTGAGMFKI